MEVFRYHGKLPAAVVGILGFAAFMMSAPPVKAAAGPSGNHTLTSPTISIDDVTMAEGNAGATIFTFTVSLSKLSNSAVLVDYQTADGTATSPSDYAAASGTLLILPNTLSTTFNVLVVGDMLIEPDENFFVNLSNPVGATIADGQGLGNIMDDDTPTSTLLSQFTVNTVAEGIELRWQFGDASGITSSWVERADAAAGPWARVAAEPITSNGVLRLVDRRVESEHTYHYRLAAMLANGQTMQFGSITATAGEIVREFALTRISPNPSTGPARVDFAMPQPARVKLSVLDVQGRVVAVLVDGFVGAGRHQAVWSGEMTRGRALPGVYFIRFDAPGGKNFVKRIVLAQ